MNEQLIRNWIVDNSTLASADVHFIRALQGTPTPYAVITRITDEYGDTHEGDDGTAEGIWQVSVFDKSLSGLKGVCASVRGLHDATITGTARIKKNSETDLYEQDAGMYHTAMRFLIQYYT